MKHSNRPTRGRGPAISIIAVILSMLCAVASAQISANIEVLDAPDGTDLAPHYVVDSDVNLPLVVNRRHEIKFAADVRFSRKASATPESETFRLSGQLLDADGDAVTLSGGGAIAYGPATEVDFAAFQTTHDETLPLQLQPGVDLGAGNAFRIRCRVQRRVEGELNGKPIYLWENVDGPDDSDRFTVVHFRDLPEDPAKRNVRGYFRGAPAWTKTHATSSGGIASQRRFALSVPYFMARYDLGGSAESVSIRLTATLSDDFGNDVPLQNGGVTTHSLLLQAAGAGSPAAPHAVTGNFTLNIEPSAQLDPRNRSYRASVRLEHLETPPATYADNGTSEESTAQRLLHFNGTLRFDDVEARFTTISNAPAAGGLGADYVNTTLGLPGGTFPGFPDYSFGAGGALSVRLFAGGDAVVTAGSRALDVAGGGDAEALFGGVRVSYPEVVVDPTGARGSSTVVHLPQGLGYTPGRSGSAGIYQPRLTLPGRDLDGNFQHTGVLASALPDDAWVFDEARPLLYRVTEFEMPNSGELRFGAADSEWAHQAAFEQLDQDADNRLHQTESMRYRLTNDGHLRFTKVVSPKVVFAAAGDGSARTAEADLEVEPGQFRTHFPHDVACRWDGNGVMKLRGGRIADGSEISGAASLDLPYDGSCEGDDCGPPAGSAVAVLRLFPKDGTLRHTPDGGLHAPADLVPAELRWGIRGGGEATHRTDAFDVAAFLASGHQIYQADHPHAQSGPLKPHAAELSPGSLTLAGYDTKKHAPVYSGTAGYVDGAGDYAGATMIAGSGHHGASRLADSAEEYGYTLREEVSKYYARRSGISGRHVAVEGTFAENLALYGYKFHFDRFQLTYLSNENEESWVNGSVDVPKPSGFAQRFLGLSLTCTGALDDAEIDPDDAGTKDLSYWNGTFRPFRMRFAPEAGGGCYGPRFLAIGLVSGAANIDTPLAGTLAFMPDGNIGTIADDIEGVDGRLGLPATLPMDGPGNETYRLTPVSKLYFNNANAPGAPGVGYVGFAARCGVPYFKDLKVHVMTSARAGVPADVFLAGSWIEGGETHFSHARFDPSHRGFPHAGTTVGDYRDPPSRTAFVPHAEQSLFGFVDLDYPLRWHPTGRYFTSWEAVESPLLVVNVEHQVDYLSAENAELSFGAQYEGLPQINLVSAAIDVADEQIGAARALTEAASSFITDTLNEGVDEIGKLVNDNLEAMLDRALDEIEAEVIDPLHAAVVQSYQDAVAANATYGDWVDASAGDLKSEFDRYLDGTIGPATGSVKGRLRQLHDAADEASNLVARVEEALERGILAIDSVAARIETVGGGAVFHLEPPTVPGAGQIRNGILAKVPDADTGALERQIVQSLVRELIATLAAPDLAAALNPLLADLTSELNGELNQLLEDFDPTLDRITEALLEARGYLVEVRGKLAAGQEIFTHFKQIVENAHAEIDAIVAGIRGRAYGFIDQMAAGATYGPTRVLGAAGDLMAEFSKEEFVAMIRAELRNRLLGADFIAQIQYALRQQISELDMAMRSAIDSAFAEVSRLCKELIKESLGPIDDAINGLIGDVNAYVGAGSLDGYAHIQGDTLRRLRLDARVQFKIPEEMELHAYFEMLCYDSGSDVGSSACLAEGERVVEVKLGALDVPLDWVSPDLRADLEVKFAMSGGATPAPLGLGGELRMTGGELDFQSLKITGFAAGMAVGANECYLAATARVVVSGYEAAGGIFFGRTCSIEPLTLVDPDAASLLGTPPFSGAYVYGEVWIPISEVVLGVPASCLFRISAGVGAGAFYFVEGPTFGGRMLLGVSGEALCLVSIRGEVSMTGVMNGGSLRFRGRGTLTGKAGWCPFCVKFRESATITYQGGSWDVDF